MSARTRMALRRLSDMELRERWNRDLVSGVGKGLPVEQSNFPAHAIKALQANANGQVLIRQDLEPILYELYVREWPYYERLMDEQSNGLVHAANQITGFGTLTPAQVTITELGNVSDDTNTYNRMTFPVAVFAARRGVSLKEMFAVSAGGAPYNPEQREIRGGILEILHSLQYHIFQGNSTYTGQTATSEAGVYNANGFDGLRIVLGQVPGSAYAAGGATPSNSPYVDADVPAQLGLASAPSNPITTAILKLVAKIRNAGGTPRAIIMSETAKYAWYQEQLQFVRFVPSAEYVPGFETETMATQAGKLPVIGVPGDSIGNYNRVSDNKLVEDIYVLDEIGLSRVWLGSAQPTVLEIPVATNGQLSQLYVLFQMSGFKQAAPLFTGKVRLPYVA